jgi:hypothetical protein
VRRLLWLAAAAGVCAAAYRVGTAVGWLAAARAVDAALGRFQRDALPPRGLDGRLGAAAEAAGGFLGADELAEVAEYERRRDEEARRAAERAEAEDGPG